ncbi:hypothetical protein M2103_000947 [Ereboglobus sp. PH5-5]|uniref:hypothetical protein n=1 Tax=Ereboglobus sp. PH5-5 TaxID=2940529 RepID=UPI0024049C9B|nr:hypothetical protein [Ereboglobus sp. PH5-5]MDF9832733.1 hypothetical protein [Ereboglobus sp. PH5-5]
MSLLKDKTNLKKFIVIGSTMAATKVKSSVWLTKKDMEGYFTVWAMPNGGGYKIVETLVGELERKGVDLVQKPAKGANMLAERLAKACPWKELHNWFEYYFAIELVDLLHPKKLGGRMALPKAELEDAVEDAMVKEFKAFTMMTQNAIHVAIEKKKSIKATILEHASRDGKIVSAITHAVFETQRRGGVTAREQMRSNMEKQIAEDNARKQAIEISNELHAIEKQLERDFKRIADDLERRAGIPRMLWNDAHKKNNEQYIVGWLLHNLPGTPDFPPEGPIRNAEAAVKNLRAAINGRKYEVLEFRYKKAADDINSALKMMQNYREKLIGGGENIIKGIEVTRDVSFGALEILVKAKTGAVGGKGVLVDGALNGLKSFANEIGKLAAGTSKGLGDAAMNITADVIVSTAGSAATGPLLQKVGGRLVPMLKVEWLKGISSNKIGEFLGKWANNIGKDIIKTIIAEVSSAARSGTSTEDFAGAVAQAVWKKIPMAALSVWIDAKFAKGLHDSLKAGLLKGVTFPAFEKMLKSLGGEFIQNTAEKSLDAVVANAKSAEQIGIKMIALAKADADFKRAMENLAKLQQKR